MVYIIDSYAWVEYFIGSKKGEALKKLFGDEANKFLTIECCLVEILGWTLKNNKDFNQILTIIKANSKICIITEHNWINAGKERFEQKKIQKNFGLIDAIILTKQKEFGCRIITGDKHFKNMRDVFFLR